MATVNIVNVCKLYEHTPILNNINISIEKGEFVAVVGSSGSGKSTLLRLVAGLESVSAGQILINNQCVNKIPPASRDIAMVFQHYGLYPHMSVYENMAYGLRRRGIKPRIIDEKIQQVAVMLDLQMYLSRKPALLSGGQRQRVAMGRAMVRSPAVFLFDEPLSNLDAKLRSEMRREIKKLHQQLKTTCLYVTHDQTEAMTLADRVVILHAGKIEQIGAPQDLYQRPASLFVAGFIGNYPTNFIEGTFDRSQRCISTSLGINFPWHERDDTLTDGQQVVLTFRAEHLILKDSPTGLSIAATIDFVDDLGADKLIQLLTLPSKIPLFVRVSTEVDRSHEAVWVDMSTSQANVYCQKTGQWIGGWNG